MMRAIDQAPRTTAASIRAGSASIRTDSAGIRADSASPSGSPHDRAQQTAWLDPEPMLLVDPTRSLMHRITHLAQVLDQGPAQHDIDQL